MEENLKFTEFVKFSILNSFAMLMYLVSIYLFSKRNNEYAVIYLAVFILIEVLIKVFKDMKEIELLIKIGEYLSLIVPIALGVILAEIFNDYSNLIMSSSMFLG